MNQRVVQTLPIGSATEIELCNDGTMKLGLLIRRTETTDVVTVLSTGLFYEFDVRTGAFVLKSRGIFTPLSDAKHRA
jgi:hypothetical protein